jgi:hypothetical protein
MSRGFQLSILVLCFVMASGALAGLGVYGTWGVTVDTGQDDPAQDIQQDEDIVDPTVETNPGVVESIVDTITPGLGIIQTLTDAVRGSTTLLTNIGLPPELANPLAAVLLLAVGLSVARFIRGV